MAAPISSNLNERKSEIRSRIRRIGKPAAVLVAFALIIAFAFAHLFSTFVRWDDEGYFLQAYRDFLSGHVLYDQVFAIYGPWTFFSAALFSGFHAANVTHDTLRWVDLALWVSIAAVLARMVWRWTGRFVMFVAVLLLAGVQLKDLAQGVGHPQIWIILGVAVLLWLGLDWIDDERRKKRAFTTGAVIGGILLFKINIGIFVLIAVALAVSLHFKGRIRRITAGLFGTIAAGCGGALLFANSSQSEKLFVFVYLASLGLIIAIAMAQGTEREASLNNVRRIAAGFAACLSLGVVMTFADGTTISGLVSGLVTSPALFVRSYHNAYTNPFSKWSLLVCLLGLVTAAAFYRMWGWLAARPYWIGLVKLTVGAGLLGAFIVQHRTALTGSLLFLWLLITDTRPVNSNRLLLAFLSALFSLQWFPMAGDQVEWAALLPMMAALVLLADGMNVLAATESPRTIWTNVAPAAVKAALAGGLFLFAGLKTGKVVHEWSRGWPVNLPGSHLLRLPANDARRFTAAVTELSRNCRTLLTLPGLYSFSIWSGVPPVEDKRINTWPFLWPEEVEKEALPKLRATARGCVLVDRKEYEFFKSLAVLKGHDELLTEIQRTMVPIYSVQDLTLYRSPEGPGGFGRGAANSR